MNIIAVDDERLSLLSAQRAISTAVPDAKLECFNCPQAALEYAACNNVDIAFLDIELSTMTGLELAKDLLKTNPSCNIIFITGHSEYALPAFDICASGYLLKPATASAVKKQLSNLRYTPFNLNSKVRVQTFGNFEIFVDDNPLIFERAKAKEFLAYLVDRRGASIPRKEIAAVLWQNKPYTRSVQTNLQKIIGSLWQTLKNANVSDILVHSHACFSVNKSAISCDYYDYISGVDSPNACYRSEYMSNYEWAQQTNDILLKHEMSK